MKNPLLDPILNRSSCRSFTGEPLQEGDLELLMEAIRRAPSAGNRQPWFFYVTENQKLKSELAHTAFEQHFIAEASVVFLACVEPEKSACRYGERGRSLFALQDVAAAIENLLIAATALGYGSCWVGSFDEQQVHDLLHLPRFRKPVAIIPVGPGNFEHQKTERRTLEKTFEIVQ